MKREYHLNTVLFFSGSTLTYRLADDEVDDNDYGDYDHDNDENINNNCTIYFFIVQQQFYNNIHDTHNHHKKIIRFN